MAIDFDPFESPTAPAVPVLCLLCAGPGWALGWAGQDRALAVHAWESGQPPLECPLGLWIDAMQLALREHLGPSPALQWCWAPLPKALRPAWWPDALRRQRPCREWAVREGLTWAGARRIAPASDLASLWGALAGPVPQVTPVRAWFAAMTRHPGACAAASLWACFSLHLALQWGVQPWLEDRRTLAWAQWAQERNAEIQRLDREREQARHDEQTARIQRWVQAQARARAPLEALAELLRTSATLAQAQFWSGLRYADGAWTVQGMAGHEVELSPWLGRPGAQALPQVLQSEPASWPPAPDWGWPAWRFEWR
ncbi:MAG: hypothetical protein RIT26_668, partial [Pseudomonadota bacterium]